MRNTRIIRLAVLGLAVAASTIYAAPETCKIDPAHSNVGFKVRLLAGKVTGRFGEVAGTIRIDAAHPETASVAASIQVRSIDTANAKRDDHLKSAGFFDAEQFPVIVFKSKKVNVTGRETADIVGDLTIHGVTKEVTLHARYLGMSKGPDGTPQTGWEATTKINRTDFGLKWNKLVEGTAMIGDEVDVDLRIISDLVKSPAR